MEKNPNKINPIVYVTRDIERALGVQPSQYYRIVTNDTAYSRIIKSQFPEFVTLISHATSPSLTYGTLELLERPETLRIIRDTNSDLLVFKNNKRVEAWAKEKSVNLLNPSAIIAEKIENKITQISWLGDIGREWLPKHQVLEANFIKWSNEPFILQWAHGHTGEGTILVDTEEKLKDIQSKFPRRLARITERLVGPSFTVNVVVAKDTICIGNISYQITGIKPFTDGTFTTIGNDWSVTQSILTDEEIGTIQSLSAIIGERMRIDGWRGLFGIDIMKDESRNKICLIEINSRQPASTTYESQLQNQFASMGVMGLNIFEAHLLAVRGQDISEPIITINDGAQIIQRVTSTINKNNISKDLINKIKSQGFDVIAYTNENINADLLRIQSKKGIMEAHNKFNERGKSINNEH